MRGCESRLVAGYVSPKVGYQGGPRSASLCCVSCRRALVTCAKELRGLQGQTLELNEKYPMGKQWCLKCPLLCSAASSFLPPLRLGPSNQMDLENKAEQVGVWENAECERI